MLLVLRIIFIALLTALPYAADAAIEAAALGPALQAARQDAGIRLALEVDCSADDGRRSARLYPSGVLTWGGERQARIGPSERAALIDALLEADFASFEDSYGGHPKAEKSGAPVIVLCRIQATAGEASKSSYQDVNGERSGRFMTLAQRLLDIVAERGAGGVAATSLADGLDKLTSGELAPEALSMQLMRLPQRGDGAGVILGVEAGEVSRRAYQPGVALGAAHQRLLTREEVHSLLATLQAASVLDLPARMAAPDLYQLRVQILQHRHSVQARPSSADGPGTDADSARLVQLAEALLALFPAP